jgi:lambda repressor-like predicted transcriptional regulator
MTDKEFNLGSYIENILRSQGKTLVWLSRQTGINYKSLHDKINYDRFKAYDLIKVAKALEIDLNKLKELV